MTKPKVWEETWTAIKPKNPSNYDEAYGPTVSVECLPVGEDGFAGRFYVVGERANEPGDDEQAVARGVLASAAPEMARLLIHLETIVSGALIYCPMCSAEWQTGDVPHADDCPWLAIMRKAGVL